MVLANLVNYLALLAPQLFHATLALRESLLLSIIIILAFIATIQLLEKRDAQLAHLLISLLPAWPVSLDLR